MSDIPSTLSPTRLMLICLVLFAGKLWLIGPHELVAVSMPHDDLLFINQAENLLKGNWLGPYDQLTLIKGPFYPLFIAAAHLLGIPFLTAQQVLYALSSAVVVWALYPVVRQRWLLVFIFLFLLLNPFSYNYPAMGRVLRLGIYQSLGLLVLASLLGIYIRSTISLKKTAGWAILAGFALSALWHTREESIWVLPTLLLIALVSIYRNRTSGSISSAYLIAVLLLPGLILAGSTFTLRMLNSYQYGIFATIEMNTQEFKSAYGGLLRIKSDNWRRFYPVVQDVREQAYRVSPTFAEIEPYLEGEPGKKWVALSHSDDLPAGFFIWAFRDAVAYGGHYKSSDQALDFYRKMGQEIDAACASGELVCRARITALMPPWHSEYNRLLIPTFLHVLKQIIHFQGFSANIDDVMSKGSSEMMQRIETLTRENLRTSRMDILRGYPEYHNHLNREKIRILNDIGEFYQAMIPLLFYGSLAVMLILGILPGTRRRIFHQTVFYLSLLAGLCSIAFILSLVVITSYASIHRAMHVSYPIVLLMIIFMILAVVELFSPSAPVPSQ